MQKHESGKGGGKRFVPKELRMLATARFLPLFVTQFLGAANDHLLKTAVVMAALYRFDGGADGAWVALAAPIALVLPFLFLSAIAGKMADSFDKAIIAKLVKGAEIIIMSAAAVAFMEESALALLGCVAAMGVHSTFFGPVKYALLPQHLRDDELMKGNAMIEGATFLAILAGTIAGGALMTDGVPISVAAAVCPVIACVGLAASLFIPAAPPTTEERINDEKRGETPRQGTIALIRWGWSDGTSLFAMLGISWFCMIGAVFLGIFPTLVRDAIGGGEELVTALLALFSIFVGVGAMASARLAPAPALRPLVGAISIMAAALVGASAALPLAAAHGVAVPIEAMAFLGIPASWPFLSCVAIAAAAGGAFSVPLYTLLQTASDDATRARSIACNNVTNALFAAFGMAGTHGLLKLGASQTQAIAFLGLLALIAALAATGLARKLAPSLLRPGRRSEAPNAD